jgi:uncharacterized protein (DUF1697 family)
VALVAFLRGVNVGGHRTFRPTVLAYELKAFDVVNVGAAGTFVVRKPVSRVEFLAALRAKLPFEAHVVLSDGRDVRRLATAHPFGTELPGPGVVRFMSILSSPVRVGPSMPIALPSDGEWLVRLIAARGQFVFGEYRRHMKTIRYLGDVDRLFGTPATTRNWNTINAILRVLDD